MLQRGSVRPSVYPLRLLIYPLIEIFRSTLRRVSGLVSSIYDANKIDQRLTNEKTRVATSILIKYNYSCSKIPHGEYWDLSQYGDSSQLAEEVLSRSLFTAQLVCC